MLSNIKGSKNTQKIEKSKTPKIQKFGKFKESPYKLTLNKSEVLDNNNGSKQEFMTDRSAILAPIEDSIFENSRTKININLTSFHNSFDNHCDNHNHATTHDKDNLLVEDLKFKKSPSKASKSKSRPTKHARKTSNIAISMVNSKTRNRKRLNSRTSKDINP